MQVQRLLFLSSSHSKTSPVYTGLKPKLLLCIHPCPHRSVSTAYLHLACTFQQLLTAPSSGLGWSTGAQQPEGCSAGCRPSPTSNAALQSHSASPGARHWDSSSSTGTHILHPNACGHPTPLVLFPPILLLSLAVRLSPAGTPGAMMVMLAISEC